MTVILLDKVNGDTVGDTYELNGGKRHIQIEADDFGGGTVILEKKLDSSFDWQTIPIQDGGIAEFTENASGGLKFVNIGMNIRARLTGSTSPSNVYVAISGDHNSGS